MWSSFLEFTIGWSYIHHHFIYCKYSHSPTDYCIYNDNVECHTVILTMGNRRL